MMGGGNNGMVATSHVRGHQGINNSNSHPNSQHLLKSISYMLITVVRKSVTNSC